MVIRYMEKIVQILIIGMEDVYIIGTILETEQMGSFQTIIL
jgi:hypothetical protein